MLCARFGHLCQDHAKSAESLEKRHPISMADTNKHAIIVESANSNQFIFGRYKHQEKTCRRTEEENISWIHQSSTA